MSRTNQGIELIDAAISNMEASKTGASGFKEVDMKNVARFAFANWKYVKRKIEQLEADNTRLRLELVQSCRDLDVLECKIRTVMDRLSSASARREINDAGD